MNQLTTTITTTAAAAAAAAAVRDQLRKTRNWSLWKSSYNVTQFLW